MPAHELHANSASPFEVLTPREQEVLALLAEQLTNEEIEERLVISRWTVKRHGSAILRKLDVPTRQKAGRLHRGKMAHGG